MTQEPTREPNCRNSIAEKAAYTASTQKKLSEAEIRLTGVRVKIRSATLAGHIVVSRRLVDAQNAVDANLAVLRFSLERFRKSGDSAWMDRSKEVDTAWENLARSLKSLVAGYSEGKNDE